MAKDIVIVGRFGAPFGVKGEIKVISFCAPQTAILDYDPWYVCVNETWEALPIKTKRASHNGVLVSIEDIEDRDEIKRLTNKDIAVAREQLPDTEEDEFYWSDLEGLSVRTTGGLFLGKIDQVMATGANDILVVQGEKRHLIPFILDHFVSKVDLDSREVIVDWDPDEK